MPKTRKSTQKSGSRVKSSGASKTSDRAVVNALSRRDRESARQRREINRELDVVDADYRKKFSQLVGRPAALELDGIRSARTPTRSQKNRRALAVLKDQGVHPAQVMELRRSFEKRFSALLMPRSAFSPGRIPHFEPCDTPAVRYAAPYAGYYWTYRWDYSSNARVPSVQPYVDVASGSVGSGIRTSVGRPDNDDRVYAECVTAFYVWHTAQSTGPLEISVSIEFPPMASSFLGKITDEVGFSECVHAQYANVLASATNSQDPSQHESALFLTEHHSGYKLGEGDTWDYVFPIAGGRRTYSLHTSSNFTQGSTVLIEAGIQHVTRFRTDDMSISTNSKLNARLHDIEVRTCPFVPVPRRRRS